MTLTRSTMSKRNELYRYNDRGEFELYEPPEGDTIIEQLRDKIPGFMVYSFVPEILDWVPLPWKRFPYNISFRGCAPKTVYLPRSRTFDHMIEVTGENLIEYNLTGEDEFLRVFDDDRRRGRKLKPVEIYIINYLNVRPETWKYVYRDLSYGEELPVDFETVGSWFHGQLTWWFRASDPPKTTCVFDTYERDFNYKNEFMRINVLGFPDTIKYPRKLGRTGRHRYRQMKIRRGKLIPTSTNF